MMPDYRLYFHDAKGHFLRAEEVELADDEAALAKARAIGHAHCIEIWCRKRKVGIVEPEGPQ
jgi:hypothetical protein